MGQRPVDLGVAGMLREVQHSETLTDYDTWLCELI